MKPADADGAALINIPARVLAAGLIGTTIEFFDFYIYATAAVLVFPRAFFPRSDPAAATMASLATFGIAFLARPIGSAIFGHFGDRIGRRSSLVISLLAMGLPTVGIGLLPTYAAIGIAAPLLLALCRFGQGLGLGGEWGGAILLAVENAPSNRRAWYGMFPQLGAPLGFVFSGGVFLLLSRSLTNAQFLSFGWRLPFLASAVLVVLGLYVRLAIAETRAFRSTSDRREHVGSPMLTIFREHARTLGASILVCLTTFVLVYLMLVFALSWATNVLGFSRVTFLLVQLICVAFFGLGICVSAILAEFGRRSTMLWVTASIGIFGLVLAPLFSSGLAGAVAMMVIGMSLMGLSFGPLGTIVAEQFPTQVRYTGSSLSFSLAGALGASSAPFIATWLARTHGLGWVGCYLSVVAAVSILGLLWIPETKDLDLTLTTPPGRQTPAAAR